MSISLSFTTELDLPIYNYKLQNASEQRALSTLKNTPNNSWIFRFDYVTKKYYLTIKKDDEYINHHIYRYYKNTDEVIVKTSDTTSEIYSNLKDFLKEMIEIYNFDLSQQVIC